MPRKSYKLPKNYILYIVLFILIVVGTLILVFTRKSDTEKYEYNLENGFETTPQKICSAGKYMLSSAPDSVKDECSKYSDDELAEYDCTTCGFNGQPVYFERTPMSNDEWKNEMC